VQRNQKPSIGSRIAHDHYESLVTFTQRPPSISRVQSAADDLPAAQACADDMIEAGSSQCQDRVTSQSCKAAKVHVLRKVSKPFGETAKLLPQDFRYPETGADDHSHVMPARVAVRYRIEEQVEQAADVDQFLRAHVVLR